MDIIFQHISYLLLTCRKVSVPGLGTFCALSERASFDSLDGIFYPSRIRIIYSPEEEKGNSLLLDSLLRKNKKDSAKIEKMIHNFSENILKKLKQNKYCRLKGIGYLLNKNGNIILQDTFWRRQRPDAILMKCV